MKKIFLFSVILSLFVPIATFAVSGKNINKKYVNIHTKQGNKWFVARKVKTDEHSSLKLKDVLPGKYKFTLDDDDKKPNQTLGLQLKMKDGNGKNIKKKTKVNAYIYIGDKKIFINTFKTNAHGYLKLEGITLNTIYELDVRGNGTIKKKNNLARVKIKTKIDGSAWFKSSYERLTLDQSGLTNGILEMKNVLPGKYKFKIKSSDHYDMKKPFTVKARMRKHNGKKIKKPTHINIYAYPYGIKTKVAEVLTDEKGWITLPGVQPHMKYRLKVKH